MGVVDGPKTERFFLGALSVCTLCGLLSPSKLKRGRGEGGAHMRGTTLTLTLLRAITKVRKTAWGLDIRLKADEGGGQGQGGGWGGGRKELPSREEKWNR